MESIYKAIQRNRFRKGKEGDSFLRLFISKRLLHGAATAMLGIFMPIFLYEMSGNTFLTVGAFYAAVSLLYVLLLAPGMKLINRIGFSHALIISGILSAFMNLLLFFLTKDNLHTLLLPIMFAMVAFWIFHWVPYHVDFALFSTRENRGKQVGITMATIAFMGVVGPLLAGFIIVNAGYPALFAVAFCLLVVATVSYAFVPETRTKFTWSIQKTWRELFNRDHRNIVVGEYASGAEIVINGVVWPIFLFEVLMGNVLEIGLVSTVVVGITIGVQLFMGRYLDAHNGSLQRTLKVGSTLYAVGWVIKIFVISTLQVFLVGLYHNIVKIFTKTPFNAMVYDMSADQGKYVDEFTVLREMSNQLGRASSLIVIAFLSIFIPIAWTFVIAAAASIALNFVYHTTRH